MRRTVLSLLQRTGIRKEARERHAPQFLGSKVPLPTIEAALSDGGLTLRHTKGEGSLYAWAWAVRT